MSFPKVGRVIKGDNFLERLLLYIAHPDNENAKYY